MTTGCRNDRGCARTVRGYTFMVTSTKVLVHAHTIRQQLGPDA